MQTAAVVVIVIAAALFLVRRFYDSLKKESRSTCGCGCSGCAPAAGCTEGGEEKGVVR